LRPPLAPRGAYRNSQRRRQGARFGGIPQMPHVRNAGCSVWVREGSNQLRCFMGCISVRVVSEVGSVSLDSCYACLHYIVRCVTWDPVNDPDPQDKSDVICESGVPWCQSPLLRGPGPFPHKSTNPYFGQKYGTEMGPRSGPVEFRDLAPNKDVCINGPGHHKSGWRCKGPPSDG
jgi:hypothetical protein